METTTRPFQLTGPLYALWYAAGKMVGPHASAAVEVAFCRGMRLPEGLDELSAVRLRQLARHYGLELT